MAREANLPAVAQGALGLPARFKTYTPYPFAGINLQDAPTAIDDREFTYVENFFHLGNGLYRTGWDVGATVYTATSPLTIVSYFFYTIGSIYYVAVFLSDGSAVQVELDNLATTTIGPAGTFFNSATGNVPACTQWGVQYLLISNNNTVNDMWAWDGSLLYTAGSAAPNGVTLQSVGANYATPPSAVAFGGLGSGIGLTATVISAGVVNVQITNPGFGYSVGDIVQVAFSGGGSDTSAILSAALNPSGVVGCTITAPGMNYTNATVAFSGGGGVNAAGTVLLNSQLQSITLNTPGSGYTSGALVAITGGGGTGATAIALTSGGAVTAVNLTNPGSGYTSTPGVAITGGGGAGAGATARSNLQSSVSALTLTAGGSNYVTPVVGFTGGGGSGAAATASVSRGVVTALALTSGGANYTSAPTVVITDTGGGGGGGGGFGGNAVLSAEIIVGQILGVFIISGGTGYPTMVTITITDSTGTGAAAFGIATNGVITHVTVTAAGSNYSANTVVTAVGGSGGGGGGGSGFGATAVASISGSVSSATVLNGGAGYINAIATFSGGGGTGATGTVTIVNGVVTAIVVTGAGSGYTSPPAITISSTGPGSGATATAVISGVVASILMTNPGSGYTTAPTATISGDGTGASAQALLSASPVASVAVTNPGSNFIYAPNIVFEGGGGAGATGIATLTATTVARINVNSPGMNYLEPPQVTIIGGGNGQGALAIAVASNSTSALISISIVNGGTGYTVAPTVTFVGGSGVGATGVATVSGGAVTGVSITNGGSGYANIGNERPVIVFGSGGATATAVLQGGQVVAINVGNPGSGFTQNAEVLVTAVTNDPGSGATGTVIFAPTTLGGVIMESYGNHYTTAPAVVIQPGANNAAYAQITLMPFGVSGSSMETFASRLWIANPKQQAYATLPPGGNWQVSVAGGFTDFATSDGGVQFTNSDNFLQTHYTNIRQSNGYLYFFGDGSASVVSSVNTSGNPATTTFNYQNIDPQTGAAWRDSMQDFGRSIIFANPTGVYGLYAGGATKVSAKLDQLFENAIFPPASGALTPTAALAHVFNIKHYFLLMTILDPDSGIPVNKMITWNERDWVVTSQSVNLTYISEQKVSSEFTAWGTDGVNLYPLFQAPSSNLLKRLETKQYGVETLLIDKELRGVWAAAQDQSVGASGVNLGLTFVASGHSAQPNDQTFQNNQSLTTSIGTLVDQAPRLSQPKPYWQAWGSGSEGLFFNVLEMRMTTLSPDFILANLVIGYTDSNAIGI